MNLSEAKRILKNHGYLLVESVSASEIEANTVYEEEYDTYRGKLENFWWSFSGTFAMSKTDFTGKSKQYKVMAGIVGQPRTRKCLATRANFSSVYEIVADYLNSLSR
jgi:hypothetical protein